MWKEIHIPSVLSAQRETKWYLKDKEKPVQVQLPQHFSICILLGQTAFGASLCGLRGVELSAQSLFPCLAEKAILDQIHVLRVVLRVDGKC